MKRWVLLRGLMRETRHWGDFTARLQAKFPADQIICLDWPGNGVLHQQRSPSDIHGMVRYLREQLIDHGHAAPYHVVAVSLGAMAAVEWARQAPQEFISATLINTSLRPFNPFYQRLRPRNYGKLLSMLWHTPAQQEQLILQLTSNQAQAAVLAQWIGYQQQYPIARRNILRQLWAALRYRSELSRPAVPLQILCSQHDQLVDPQCSQTLAAAWQIPCITHPSAGHDLPLDDPQWVIQQLSQLISI
ncbi:alpha/beta fold hydrolase [Deefgea rivuli]|uniref:alpha/beta fold hydrolase n=1 Tax=Deefgea rivuli TaxID=400948 RepID=UPI00047F83D8|nr:alpha/beta hydrolase [Deefgea rivuli]